MQKMPFERKNYVLMIIGILILLSGFGVMAMDKEEFGFGILGLWIGPIMVFIGFMFEIFAILYSSRKNELS